MFAVVELPVAMQWRVVIAAGIVNENHPPLCEMNWSEVVAATPLTLQYIGLVPVLETITVAPVGRVPLESEVVTVIGVPRAPEAEGTKPETEAVTLAAVQSLPVASTVPNAGVVRLKVCAPHEATTAKPPTPTPAGGGMLKFWAWAGAMPRQRNSASQSLFMLANPSTF
jgi:hypothetical protein